MAFQSERTELGAHGALQRDRIGGSLHGNPSDFHIVARRVEMSIDNSSGTVCFFTVGTELSNFDWCAIILQKAR